MTHFNIQIARKYLPNVILPFLFFELWYVIIAFVFVVLIETLLVKLFLREKFLRLFKILLKANFWTTIIGYLIQGIIRLLIGFVAFASIDKITDNELFNSIVGNVGLDNKMAQQMDKSIVITLLTSVIIAFIISVIVERRIVIKEFGESFSIKNITIIVTIANIVSYILLFVWIYYNYLRLHK